MYYLSEEERKAVMTMLSKPGSLALLDGQKVILHQNDGLLLIKPLENKEKHPPISLSDFIDQFNDRAGKKALTTQAKEASIIKDIKEKIGNLNIDQIDEKCVQERYLDVLIGEGKNKKTVADYWCVLKSILVQACFLDYMDDNPDDYQPFFGTKEGGHREVMNDKDYEIWKSLGKDLTHRDEQLYHALSCLGLRPEEIRGLKGNDYMPKDRKIQINSKVTIASGKAGYESTTKNLYSVREIDVPEWIANILGQHKVYEIDGLIFGNGYEPYTEYRFNQIYESIINKGIEKGMSKKYPIACTRHSYCTHEFEDNKKSRAELAKEVGHCDTRLMKNTYARVRTEGIEKFWDRAIPHEAEDSETA